MSPSRQHPDPTLHLPRILCLHGGGTNAEIFHAQCRVLRAQLKSTFRFCFADAPFICEAGPDVTRVYKDNGPFRRWFRWLPEHPEVEAGVVIEAVEQSIQTAIEMDNEKGATGEWVALLGFSQGAKVCASLLFRQQVRASMMLPNYPDFNFGVLMAGRGPLVALEHDSYLTPRMSSASELSSGSPSSPSSEEPAEDFNILKIPTLHVHGLKDDGLEYHRHLRERWCSEESGRVIEWDGGHRIPINPAQVEVVAGSILRMAKETGSLRVTHGGFCEGWD